MPYFRYRLCNADGSEAGEAEYAVRIAPGEIIWTSDGRPTALVALDGGTRKRIRAKEVPSPVDDVAAMETEPVADI